MVRPKAPTAVGQGWSWEALSQPQATPAVIQQRGRSPTHAWLRTTQFNCRGTGPPCVGWEEGPSVLTEITAHVIKRGLSRGCPLGVTPGPQVPAAQ